MVLSDDLSRGLKLRWFKGGSWRLDAHDVGHATAYTAVLPAARQMLERTFVPMSSLQGKPRRKAPRLVDTAAALGLEPYTPGRQEVTRLISRMCVIQKQWEPNNAPLEEATDKDCLLLALLDLVRDYGPLGAAGGAVGPWDTWSAQGQEYRVDLESFYDEIVWIAHLSQALLTDREWAIAKVREGLQGVVPELYLVPRGTAEDLPRFESSPVSLRALLWMVLFERADTEPNACLYCNEWFIRLPMPGRPPSYCEQHRGSKYRRAVAKRMSSL